MKTLSLGILSDLSGGPPSVSDFALVRKQFFIFERAVSKFKSDLGIWVQYIQLAKKEGAKGLAGRICARCVLLNLRYCNMLTFLLYS